MENIVSTIMISIGVTASFLYLIINIILQVKAKRHLEIKLRLRRKDLEEKFRVQKSSIHYRTKEEILVTLLREEIDELIDGTEKKVMKKTLDRKNFDNQKQYARRIFSESGLIDTLGFK